MDAQLKQQVPAIALFSFSLTVYLFLSLSRFIFSLHLSLLLFVVHLSLVNGGASLRFIDLPSIVHFLQGLFSENQSLQRPSPELTFGMSDIISGLYDLVHDGRTKSSSLLLMEEERRYSESRDNLHAVSDSEDDGDDVEGHFLVQKLQSQLKNELCIDEVSTLDRVGWRR